MLSQRKLTFKVKGNNYDIDIPTPRQLIQIEAEKAAVTSNYYRGIMASGTVGASYSLDIVDMHSYLTVLAPDLMDDIFAKTNVPLLDMDLFDQNELMKEYRNQFIPWVNSWMKILNAVPEQLPEVDQLNDTGSNKEKVDVDLNSGEETEEQQ